VDFVGRRGRLFFALVADDAKVRGRIVDPPAHYVSIGDLA
jgi:hypothetical protein